MGIAEISQILKNNYPNWMTEDDIVIEVSIGVNGVRKSLKRMKKRLEIDIMIASSRVLHGKNKTYYRQKKEEIA